MRFGDKLRIVRKLNPDGEKVWSVISALNDLRAAAAHRNYEKLRDERFEKLHKLADYYRAHNLIDDRELFLRSIAAYCFG